MAADRRGEFEAGLGGLPVAPGVAITEVVGAPVPAQRHHPDGGYGSTVICYFHGGAYTVGSPTSHRASLSFLAHDTGADIIAFDYRLAPEHPFPAAVEDGVACLAWTTATHPGARIVVAGDSAGGGLSLATLVRTRDEGGTLPAATVLISPWADLRCNAEAWTANADSDAALEPTNLRAQAAAYLGPSSADEPLASPVLADLTGLPPMFVIAGGGEILLDDATTVVDNALAAGVKAELHVADGCMHAFALFPHFPESGAARAAVASFLGAR